MSNKPPQPTSGRDVLHFIPNYIGYFRVACSLTSFLLMIGFPRLWLFAIILYLLNFIGDLFDGLVARKLNQCSSFGGILDMLTDRCSTAGLLMILSVEYIPIDETLSFPLFRIIFLLLVLLDVSSHWMQTYSVLATGHHHKSKEGNKGRNILVVRLLSS
jgi:CDP-diacylglycerol--inositol 3-phosphatidyltransferase